MSAVSTSPPPSGFPTWMPPFVLALVVATLSSVASYYGTQSAVATTLAQHEVRLSTLEAAIREGRSERLAFQRDVLTQLSEMNKTLATLAAQQNARK